MFISSLTSIIIITGSIVIFGIFVSISLFVLHKKLSPVLQLKQASKSKSHQPVDTENHLIQYITPSGSYNITIHTNRSVEIVKEALKNLKLIFEINDIEYQYKALNDLKSFKEHVDEMKNHPEVATGSKEAYVTGEVSLEKEVHQSIKTVENTLRKTKVDIENLIDITKNLSE